MIALYGVGGFISLLLGFVAARLAYGRWGSLDVALVAGVVAFLVALVVWGSLLAERWDEVTATPTATAVDGQGRAAGPGYRPVTPPPYPSGHSIHAAGGPSVPTPRSLPMRVALLLVVLLLSTVPPEHPAAAHAEASLYPVPTTFTVATTAPLTLVDPTRDDREVPVMVRYPADAPAPVPVVVWSHGGGPRPAGGFANEAWGELLAAAGYAVVHIVHLSDRADEAWACARVGLTPCDASAARRYLRPGDAITVLDRLADVVAARPELAGRLDLDRVVMAGHSNGAFTTLAVAGAPFDIPGGAHGVSFASTVPSGYLALSPAIGEPVGFAADAWAALDEPVLMASGAGDAGPFTSEDERDDAFVGMPATGRGALLWIDDPAAVHATFNLGTPGTAATAWIAATVVAWLDATLEGRADATDWLASDALAQVSGRVADIRRT